MKKSKLSLLFTALSMLLSSCGLFGQNGGGLNDDGFSPLPQDEGFFLIGNNYIGDQENCTYIYYNEGEYLNRMRTVYPKDIPSEISKNVAKNASLLRSYKIQDVRLGVGPFYGGFATAYKDNKYYYGDESLSFYIVKGQYNSSYDYWEVREGAVPSYDINGRRNVSLTPDSLFVFDSGTMTEKYVMGQYGDYWFGNGPAVCLSGAGIYDVYILEFSAPSSVRYGLGIIKTKSLNGAGLTEIEDYEEDSSQESSDSTSEIEGYEWYISNKDELTKPWSLNGEPREIKIHSTPEVNLSSLVLRGDANISLSNTHVVDLNRTTLTPSGYGTVTVTVSFDGKTDSVDITIDPGAPLNMSVADAIKYVEEGHHNKLYVSVNLKVVSVFSNGFVFVGGEDSSLIFVENTAYYDVSEGYSYTITGFLNRNTETSMPEISGVLSISRLDYDISVNVDFGEYNYHDFDQYYASISTQIVPVTGYVNVIFSPFNSDIVLEFPIVDAFGNITTSTGRYGFVYASKADDLCLIDNLNGIYKFKGYLCGNNGYYTYLSVVSYETIVAGNPPQEPDLIHVSSFQEAIDYSSQDYSHKFFISDVIVQDWRNGQTTAGAYGNFHVTDGVTTILVYGATATETALTWDNHSYKYVFTNPKDFLTNDLTKNIQLGYVLDIEFVVTSYNNQKELHAIIKDARPGEWEEVEGPEPVYINSFSEIDTSLAFKSVKYVINNVTVSRWYGLNTNANTSGQYYLVDSNGIEVLTYKSSATAEFKFQGATYTCSSPLTFLEDELTSTVDIHSILSLEFIVSNNYTNEGRTSLQILGKVLSVDNTYYESEHNIGEPTPIETSNIADIYSYDSDTDSYLRVGFNFHNFTITEISSLTSSSRIYFSDSYGNSLYSYCNSADKESAFKWDIVRGLYQWQSTFATLDSNPMTQNLGVGSVVSGFCIISPHGATFEIFAAITEVHNG